MLLRGDCERQAREQPVRQIAPPGREPADRRIETEFRACRPGGGRGQQRERAPAGERRGVEAPEPVARVGGAPRDGPPSARLHGAGRLERVLHAPAHEHRGSPQVAAQGGEPPRRLLGGARRRARALHVGDAVAAPHELRHEARRHRQHEAHRGRDAAEQRHDLVRVEHLRGVREQHEHAGQHDAHACAVHEALQVERAQPDAEQLGGAGRREQRVRQRDDGDEGQLPEERAARRPPTAQHRAVRKRARKRDGQVDRLHRRHAEHEHDGEVAERHDGVEQVERRALHARHAPRRAPFGRSRSPRARRRVSPMQP